MIKKLFMLFGLMMAVSTGLQAKSKAEKTGWKIAIQSYTFHLFTLQEALDKCQELGVKYIEVYPGHKLGEGYGELSFGPDLNAQTLKRIRQDASRRGVRIVGSGVFTSDNKEDWTRFFQMAKAMKFDYVTCEPNPELWDHVEALSTKYGIRVAVHNHPRPSTYWNPDALMELIQNRAKGIGSCADIGHWNRQGLDELECLRRVGHRLVTFHFKDIAPKREGEAEQTDVIWGTGCLKLKQILAHLRDMKFKGYLAVEYEANWMNSVPDIRKSLQYFDTISDEVLIR